MGICGKTLATLSLGAIALSSAACEEKLTWWYFGMEDKNVGRVYGCAVNISTDEMKLHEYASSDNKIPGQLYATRQYVSDSIRNEDFKLLYSIGQTSELKKMFEECEERFKRRH